MTINNTEQLSVKRHRVRFFKKAGQHFLFIVKPKGCSLENTKPNPFLSLNLVSKFFGNLKRILIATPRQAYNNYLSFAQRWSKFHCICNSMRFLNGWNNPSNRGHIPGKAFTASSSVIETYSALPMPFK